MRRPEATLHDAGTLSNRQQVVTLHGAGTPVSSELGPEVTLHSAGTMESLEISDDEVARVKQQSATPAELQQLQSEGDGPVAVMYRARLEEEILTEEQLSLGS